MNAPKHRQPEVCELLSREIVTAQLRWELQERDEVFVSPNAFVAIPGAGWLLKLDLVDRQFDFRRIAPNG